MMSKLFQTQCPLLIITVIVYTMPLLSGCRQQSYSSPEGYDLNQPQKMQLGKVLNEISGLTFNPQHNDVLAISDDKEKVIEIDIHQQKLKDVATKFSKPGQDFEDLALLDSTVYILASKGKIKSVSLVEGDTSGVQEYELNLPGKNEFETLYYDADAGGLVVLCKDCDADNGLHGRAAFRFDLADKRFEEKPYYIIETDKVREAVDQSKIDVKPSAAAIHPIDQQLYILSSASHLLIIADKKGKVKKAYRLNPALFPQAEGIAFTPTGGMFISNESKNGKPTLLYFPYHQTDK